VCCTIPVDTGTTLNAAEHIRITLDHGFGDGLHVLVIATDGGCERTIVVGCISILALTSK
jgi:hypothetical protein